MNILTYLAFGLVCAHADAMACFVSKRRYHIAGSVACCMVWPVVSLIVIINTARGNRIKNRP